MELFSIYLILRRLRVPLSQNTVTADQAPDLGNRSRVEYYLRGCDISLQMSDVRRTRDRNYVLSLRQQPGQCQLRQGMAGDRGQHV